MSENIKVKINGIEIECQKGQTILQVAKANGIDIPNMCYSEKVKLYGACGVCVVEVKGVPKLLRSCASFVSDGMEIETETDRVRAARKVALELMLSDHDGNCRPPCAKACPAGTDCQGYVGLIANGKFAEANMLIKEKIPLPAAIGRVCPHPCESKCRRAAIDDAVQIAYLKRFAADLDRELNGDNLYTPAVGKATGKKVAVIGGGPAGLSAAYSLRRKGHEVTVFDQMPKMGGMLRYGIPEYRLPKAILDVETKSIEKMGVTFKNNVKIGTNGLSVNDIAKEFDATCISIGNWVSQKMRIPGEEFTGVIGGIDFLRKVVNGENIEIGDKVAIVGGGNTAMDACRTAVRCGAKEVYVFYRRTRAEMPANEIEIVEAEEEGVVFKFLCNPAEILSENGKVTAVKAQKMELGEPDASGRRSPVPIEGEFDVVPVNTVIMAIGQKINADGFEDFPTTKKGDFEIDPKTFMTNVPGIFACGDAATNGMSKIAVSAIAGGNKVAASIDNYLTGRVENFDFNGQYDLYSEINLTQEQIREQNPDKVPLEKIEMAFAEASERKDNFKEYMYGFTKEEAMEEASKCLECGCMDYYECKLIDYANRYNSNPTRVAGIKHAKQKKDLNEYIVRDNAKCMLCGLCVRACEEVNGITALGLVGRGFDTYVSPEMGLPLDHSQCTGCGLCVSLCPTGALGEKLVLRKKVPLPTTKTVSKCRFCEKACDVQIEKYGDALVKVVPGEGTVNLCHLGRFGYTMEGNEFVEGNVKELVKKLITESLDNVPSLDTSNVHAIISRVHSKNETLSIIAAVKDLFPNATFSAGKSKKTDDSLVFENKLFDESVFNGLENKSKETLILTFGENLEYKDDNASTVKLPFVFDKI